MKDNWALEDILKHNTIYSNIVLKCGDIELSKEVIKASITEETGGNSPGGIIIKELKASISKPISEMKSIFKTGEPVEIWEYAKINDADTPKGSLIDTLYVSQLTGKNTTTELTCDNNIQKISDITNAQSKTALGIIKQVSTLAGFAPVVVGSIADVTIEQVSKDGTELINAAAELLGVFVDTSGKSMKILEPKKQGVYSFNDVILTQDVSEEVTDKTGVEYVVTKRIKEAESVVYQGTLKPGMNVITEIDTSSFEPKMIKSIQIPVGTIQKKPGVLKILCYTVTKDVKFEVIGEKYIYTKTAQTNQNILYVENPLAADQIEYKFKYIKIPVSVKIKARYNGFSIGQVIEANGVSILITKIKTSYNGAFTSTIEGVFYNG